VTKPVTLSDQSCPERGTLWLEFGGRKGTEVVYSGGGPDPQRKHALVIDGIETCLVEDATFEQFQKQTKVEEGYGTAGVTVVGRYFSGKKRTIGGETFWGGFGHFGMNTLLVIEQVKQVQTP
jgi:hypothetical protein